MTFDFLFCIDLFFCISWNWMKSGKSCYNTQINNLQSTCMNRRCDGLMKRINEALQLYRNYSSKERIINNDQYCFRKQIIKCVHIG